jgi:hypothetical protein
VRARGRLRAPIVLDMAKKAAELARSSKLPPTR